MSPVVLLLVALGVLAAAALAQSMGLGDLRALYDTCSRRVMAVALHLLRDRAEAEDVVQETFLELWRRTSAYDSARGGRENWAVLIARSRALDRLRARASAARAEERAAADSPDPSPVPFDLAHETEQGAQVRRALASLPVEQRQVIELAFFAGLTHTEIATRTSEPLGTVKTRVRLAMEKLAARLAEEGP